MSRSDTPAPKSPSSASNPSGRRRTNAEAPAPVQSFEILVVGGGEAGLAVLEELRAVYRPLTTALIEPSAYHYEQPKWLRVGTEGMAKERTRSRQVFRVPPGVTWICERAAAFDPERRRVVTAAGTRVEYEFLVVATGIEGRWDRLRGLPRYLGTNGVCSVYGYEQAARAWEMIRGFSGGRALFSAPSSPFKGGGAPLEVVHAAEKVWTETGVIGDTEIVFATAARHGYAGNAYAELLERDAAGDDVRVYTGYDLVEVRGDRREAVFTVAKDQAQSGDVLPYDFLHVVPPMRPPTAIEDSRLAYQVGPMKGFLAVDPATLRHKRFSTVYGVGDVNGIEMVKTGERARLQAAAVARRIVGA